MPGILSSEGRKLVRDHHGLALDYLQSADILWRNLKYRHAVPLLRRALIEEVTALAALGGTSGDLAWSLARLGDDRALYRIIHGIDPGAALAGLERLETEAQADPFAVQPSSERLFGERLAELLPFFRRADLFIEISLLSPRQRWARNLARVAIVTAFALLLSGTPLIYGTRWLGTRRGGLKAQYYAGQTLERPRSQRIDKTVDFSWNRDNLPSGLHGLDHFSARWTGRLHAPEAGSYEVIVRSDDGARLWLADKLAVDAWVKQAPTDHAVTFTLERGWHALKLEYFQDAGGADCQLLWVPPGGIREVIGPRFLRPD